MSGLDDDGRLIQHDVVPAVQRDAKLPLRGALCEIFRHRIEGGVELSGVRCQRTFEGKRDAMLQHDKRDVSVPHQTLTR